MQLQLPEINIENVFWHDWFAWYPVFFENKIFWMEWVQRSYLKVSFCLVSKKLLIDYRLKPPEITNLTPQTFEEWCKEFCHHDVIRASTQQNRMIICSTPSGGSDFLERNWDVLKSKKVQKWETLP